MPKSISRRIFLAGSAAAAAAGCTHAAPAVVIPESQRPATPCGVNSGDVTTDSAIVWSRTDRPARMLVEWSTTESFKELHRAVGSNATPDTDFTARLDLTGLPPNQRIFYRITFMSLENAAALSQPLVGTFRTAPLAAGDITFAWSGDTAGQGWGINPAFGGFRIYNTIRNLFPDFLIHSGDNIYADQEIGPGFQLEDGRIWRNLTTPDKLKVAQTLDDFRGNYRYNLMDLPLKQFNASVPILAQWDDHEVHNNWYPGQILDDPRYTEKRIDVLSAFANRAFHEYLPVRPCAEEPGRVYRSFHFGPLLDVFLLDERSYRGPNNANRSPAMSPQSAFLGRPQLDWLKRELTASKATWKVIASDMPLGYVIGDGPGRYEALANGDDGVPLGRELEIAELLAHCKQHAIRNLVFLTADVHHPAAFHYHPDRAAFKNFDPFWEFVTGPLHAGCYAGGPIDMTFGPERRFYLPPPFGGAGPNTGFQFFGLVKIDGKSEVLTLTQHNLIGERKYQVELTPEKA